MIKLLFIWIKEGMYLHKQEPSLHVRISGSYWRILQMGYALSRSNKSISRSDDSVGEREVESFAELEVEELNLQS